MGRLRCNSSLHQDNTPLLYSKTRVHRGVHIFLIFALKHRLWVLVRTASLTEAVLTYTNNLCFDQKNKKNVTFFHLKIQVFTALKNCSILHGHVIEMACKKAAIARINDGLDWGSQKSLIVKIFAP